MSSPRKSRASSASNVYTRSAIPVSAEGLVSFDDSWSPIHDYSSSSSYASPGYDYNNLSHVESFDASYTRIRHHSDSSLLEPWHPYQHPLSPVSPTSSLLFSWADAEKSPGLHALGLSGGLTAPTYSNTESLLSTSTDPLADLVMFSMPVGSYESRDDEERKYLIPNDSFGLATDTYQSALYLEHYWQHFHPAFPVVHRASFHLDPEAQAPLLRAAMMAVGAQYSDAPNSQVDSLSLHERCVKVLSQVNIKEKKAIQR